MHLRAFGASDAATLDDNHHFAQSDPQSI